MKVVYVSCRNFLLLCNVRCINLSPSLQNRSVCSTKLYCHIFYFHSESTWIIHCLNNDRTKYSLMYCGPLDSTGGLDIFFQFSFLLKCTYYGHNSFTISQKYKQYNYGCGHTCKKFSIHFSKFCFKEHQK